MITRRLAAATALALATAATAQNASPPAAPPADTITVTGTRLSPEVLHQRAVDFVHATGVAAGEVAAARWTEPVCPHVVGLNDEPARVVEAKVRSVAADAGIALAPTPCRANVAVVFATDGAAVVRAMLARRASQFAGVAPAAIAALTRGTVPIRWWYSTEARDRDGSPATTLPSPWSMGNGEGGGSVIPMGPDTTSVQHYATSLVSTETIRALRTATVVVDVTRTDGLPLGAVASFAAMVALAEIRAGATPPGSVLGLFGGGAIERSPTAWDMAFLRALYRLPLDRTAARQRGRLVADLVAAQAK